MYLYAWKAGLKTTYYLRSRPATRIQQATVAITPAAITPAVLASAALAPAALVSAAVAISAEDALACSLENPESCEACQ